MMKLSVFSFVRPDFPDGRPLTLSRRQGFQIILSNRYALHFRSRFLDLEENPVEAN